MDSVCPSPGNEHPLEDLSDHLHEQPDPFCGSGAGQPSAARTEVLGEMVHQSTEASICGNDSLILCFPLGIDVPRVSFVFSIVTNTADETLRWQLGLSLPTTLLPLSRWTD